MFKQYLFKQTSTRTFAAQHRNTALMKIEEAIRQGKPMSPLHKVMINLIYTYHWHIEQAAAIFKPFGITPQQYNVLRILRGRYPEAAPVGEVKAVLLDRNPDLTRLCDRLLEKGLLERALNCHNRREVLLKITPAGLDLLERIEPVFAEVAKEWETLSPEESETLSNLLDKLRGR